MDHRRLFEVVLRSFFLQDYNEFEYDGARVEHLGRTLQQARRQGVEVVVLVSPVHALQLEAMRLAGLDDEFERLKRELVEVAEAANRLESSAPPVAVWDFTGYRGRLAEAVPAEGSLEPMTWFVESSHFSAALGHEIAARIRGLPGADPAFGTRLEKDELEEHLARFRREREDYARREADEVAWIESIFRESSELRARAGRRIRALRAYERR